VEVGHAKTKTSNWNGFHFSQFLLFSSSVIRFFSVLTRFHCSCAFHADLAAEASRAVFQRQHLLVSASATSFSA
jgi:hypothetical protein